MNIGRKRIRVDHIPKDHFIFEDLTDETLKYNTDPSNFEDSEDRDHLWKYGDRIVYMGGNQLHCYIAGYIGYNNKLTHTPPSEFKYGSSPCPEDHELVYEEEDDLDEEDEEDEEDEQYGGKKSRNRKSRKREKKSKNRKTSKERKSRKSKKMKPRKKMSKKRKSRKNKPRKNKSTRKH